MVKEKIRNTIKQHDLIKPEDVIILGLSGGPDSACLFEILTELSQEMDFQVHGAHVNHQFRPGDAEEDQIFVENLCEAKGVCCWSTTVDCNQMARDLNLGGEEAGRKARYEFFSQIVKSMVEEGTDESKIKIAIAHNLDDQVETVLFRFLRGVGTDGLSGIDYKRVNENGNLVIRPLLDVSKKEILEYCERKDIEYCVDYTNSQPIYTRNKIRLELIPYLKENYNSRLVDSIKRLSEIAKDDSDFIWSQVEEVYNQALVNENEREIWFKQGILQGIHPAICHRIILKAFSSIGLQNDVYSTHLKQGEQLILTGATPQKIDFPQHYEMRVSYGNIICRKKKIAKDIFDDSQMIIKIVKRSDYQKQKNVAAFDLDQMSREFNRNDISDLIEFRTRRPGDYIRLKGMKGRKKIQDLFVDMKIPSMDRDQIKVVAIGHEVLWIPDGQYKGRYSGNYPITENTKNVIFVEVRGLV